MTELVGLAVRPARAEAATGQPHTETVRVVVPAHLPWTRVVLDHRQPAHLATPVNHRRIQQTPLLQVRDQRRRRAVHLQARRRQAAADRTMMVPVLVLGEQLHKPHAPLDQPAGDQTTCPELDRRLLVQAVQLVGRLRFAAEIQRLTCRRLHPRGQAEVGDPCLEFQLTLSLRDMSAIELGQQVEEIRLHLTTQPFGRIEIQDPRLPWTDHRPLEQRRQPAVGPIQHALDRQTPRIGHRHVRRQLVGLGTQAERQPATQRRTAPLGPPGVHRVDRLAVVVHPGVHRPHHQHVVDNPGETRKQLRDRRAALTVLPELPRAAQHT